MGNDIIKFETIVDEAMENVDVVKAIMLSLNKEIDGINFRLPGLIVEKKTATSKRDFKKAGKASKLIKDLIMKKICYENELNGDAAQLYTKNMEELVYASNMLFHKRTCSHEKEGKCAKRRMKLLAKKFIRLECKKSYLGIVTEEQTVSNIHKDVNNILEFGKIFFNLEVATLVKETVQLSHRFG